MGNKIVYMIQMIVMIILKYRIHDNWEKKKNFFEFMLNSKVNYYNKW